MSSIISVNSVFLDEMMDGIIEAEGVRGVVLLN